MGIPAAAGVGASGTPPAGDQANAVVSGQLTAVGPGLPFAFNGPFNLSIWDSVTTALTTTQGSSGASVASGTGLAAGCAVNSVNVPAGTTWATFSGTSGTLALPGVSQFGAISAYSPLVTGLQNTAGLVGATVTGPGIPSGTTVVQVITPAVPGTINSPPQGGAVMLSAPPTQTNPNAPLVFALTNQAITTGTDNNAVFTGSGLTYSGTVEVQRSFDGGSTWIAATFPGTAGTLIKMTAGTPFSQVLAEPERGVLYRVNCTAFTSGTINYRLSASGAAAMSLALSSPV